MPSSIINFNGGVPPVEEQYMVEQSIMDKFSGTTNAGKFILSFNDNPEYRTTVEMLRTTNKLIADYNPSDNYSWVYGLIDKPNSILIKSTVIIRGIVSVAV